MQTTAQPITKLGALNIRYIALRNQIREEEAYRYPDDLIDQLIVVRNTIVEIQNTRRTGRQREARRLEVSA